MPGLEMYHVMSAVQGSRMPSIPVWSAFCFLMSDSSYFRFPCALAPLSKKCKKKFVLCAVETLHSVDKTSIHHLSSKHVRIVERVSVSVNKLDDRCITVTFQKNNVANQLFREECNRITLCLFRWIWDIRNQSTILQNETQDDPIM